MNEDVSKPPANPSSPSLNINRLAVAITTNQNKNNYKYADMPLVMSIHGKYTEWTPSLA